MDRPDMDRPNSLENIFIRYDVLSHEVALIGGAQQLKDYIQRYGSAIVRDLMTNTRVEVYERQDRLMGRPVGKWSSRKAAEFCH